MRTFCIALVATAALALGAAAPARAGTETVLHYFGSGGDGAFPVAPLLLYNGTLYGTTNQGGGAPPVGMGTVFAVTPPQGSETVLYSFGGIEHYPPASPTAGLTNVNGTLYGTTANTGSVFSITPQGTLTGLYLLGVDSYPAGLVNVNGTLYGTTMGGGTGFGTVYSITPQGTVTVLYSFAGYGGGAIGDGAFPRAGLIYVNGTLYGTTYLGGQNDFGTVFAVTPGGTERVVYSFAGGADGANPVAPLLYHKGALYGTTFYGGADNLGTVFSITRQGIETVLHSFAGTDGAWPAGGLVDGNGTFFGTTYGGGTKGLGTVFSLTPQGAERVLHSFAGSPADGAYPAAGLVYQPGILYGTTFVGGPYHPNYNSYGGGTVFELTLP